MATKKRWKAKIKKAAKDAGTYKPVFDSVIDTLAGILERRDAAQDKFEAEGCEILIEYTNKSGATNYIQNPALKMVNDLERDALTYWRDLGLTPAGLKKINDEAFKSKPESALAAALRELEN